MIILLLKETMHTKICRLLPDVPTIVVWMLSPYHYCAVNRLDASLNESSGYSR